MFQRADDGESRLVSVVMGEEFLLRWNDYQVSTALYILRVTTCA